MTDPLLDRILRTAGAPDLLDVLADRLEPTDRQSLLLGLYRRVAKKVTPAQLLRTYEENRFSTPSPIDPRRLVELDRLAWSLLPEAYSPIELSPVCPLGTCSAVATVDQNNVLTTIRNTEVVSDSTNVLALECAVRRRRFRQAGEPGRPVLFAASHRLLRTAKFKGKGMFAHFRILSMCAAGRDEGSHRFETTRLLEQLAYYVSVIRRHLPARESPLPIRVAVTDLTDGALGEVLEERVLAPLRAQFINLTSHLDPSRKSGRGYYRDVCFKLYMTDNQGADAELGDGGMVPWTQSLLSDRKERLLISGLGVERLLAWGFEGP